MKANEGIAKFIEGIPCERGRAMKESFPYPLPEWALRRFCALAGPLAAPVRFGGDVVAANGFVAVKSRRGAWIDEDFLLATGEVRERIERLPWAQWTDDQAWKPLADAERSLMRRGPIGVWLKERIAPSPVVRVAGGPVARVSLLQLVAKLPRAEVYVGNQTLMDPVRVRFSGGVAIIAAEKALQRTPPAWEIFKPSVDCLTGEIRQVRHVAPRGNFGTPPPPEPSLDDWPPAETDFS